MEIVQLPRDVEKVRFEGISDEEMSDEGEEEDIKIPSATTRQTRWGVSVFKGQYYSLCQSKDNTPIPEEGSDLLAK
jgi:hypothetical protein